MVEVLAFQVDPRPAAVLPSAGGRSTAATAGRRSADKGRRVGREGRIGRGLVVLDGQLVQSASQSFGNIASAELAEAAGGVGKRVVAGIAVVSSEDSKKSIVKPERTAVKGANGPPIRHARAE